MIPALRLAITPERAESIIKALTALTQDYSTKTGVVNLTNYFIALGLDEKESSRKAQAARYIGLCSLLENSFKELSIPDSIYDAFYSDFSDWLFSRGKVPRKGDPYCVSLGDLDRSKLFDCMVHKWVTSESIARKEFFRILPVLFGKDELTQAQAVNYCANRYALAQYAIKYFQWYKNQDSAQYGDIELESKTYKLVNQPWPELKISNQTNDQQITFIGSYQTDCGETITVAFTEAQRQFEQNPNIDLEDLDWSVAQITSVY